MRTLKHYANPLFFLNALLTSLALYYASFDNTLFFDSTSLTSDFGKNVQMSSLFQMRWLSHITFAGIDPENTATLQMHHIINVLIHAFNAFLVFAFTRKLITTRASRFSLTACIISASLFLVASSQTYAVAYLIQRSILMATMFILISLICFMRAIEFRRTIDFLLAALFYYLGCVSKEHVAVIVLFYPILDYFLQNKINSSKSFFTIDKFVFYSVVILVCILMIRNHEITPFTAYESHAQAYLDDLKTQSQGTPWLLLNFVNQSTMLFRYVLLFLLPLTQWMSIDLHYVFPTNIFGFPHIIFACASLVLAGCTVVFLRKSTDTSRVLALCVFGIFISFSTEFSVVRITEPFVLYRSYFWMIFFIPLLSIIFDFLFYKLQPAVIGAVLILFLGSHVLGTVNRLQTFEALQPLWQDTLAKLDRTAPGSYRSLNSYGMALASEGKYTEALTYIDESIARNPHYAISYYNKAYCHQFLNQPELALSNYQKTLSLNPNYADAHINTGAILIEQKRIDEALKHLQLADSINPHNFKTKNNLGALYDRLNKPEQSIEYYQLALNLRPNDAPSLTNLGLSLMKLDKVAEALPYLKKAHEIDPSLIQAQLNLGMACQKTGDYDCAMKNFSEILTAHPQNTAALLQIANVQTLQNKPQAAIITLHQVLSYDANNTIAHYNLGVLHARKQDYANAELYFKSCLRITPSDQNCIQALDLLRKQSQN